QVWALPVQGKESLGHAGDVELPLAYLLDVAHVEIADQAGDHGTAEGAQALGREEPQEANAPLSEQHQHGAPAHPAEHHPPSDARALLAFDLLNFAELALLFGRNEQPELARCLSHRSPR